MSATLTETPAAPTDDVVPGDRLHRITLETYEAMAEQGLLTKRDRVVLIDGLLVKKMTKHPPHVVAANRVFWLLHRLGIEGYYLRKEDPIRLPGVPPARDSSPEPDVVLARGTLDDHARRHPNPDEIALIVEVAKSSAAEDRKMLPAFARAGIPAVWIVDLNRATIEVFSGPVADEDEGGARYATARSVGIGDAIEVNVAGRVYGPIRPEDVLA